MAKLKRNPRIQFYKSWIGDVPKKSTIVNENQEQLLPTDPECQPIPKPFVFPRQCEEDKSEQAGGHLFPGGTEIEEEPKKEEA